MVSNPRIVAVSIVGSWLMAFAGAAHADASLAFPTSSVRIIVPTAAGGTGDALPRMIVEELRKTWKKSIIIENIPGGGGNIGAEQFSRAPADGYTLLAAPPNSLAINQSLYRRIDYNPNAFEPITILATSPNLLVVRANSSFNSIQEVIERAKQNPSTVSFASPGTGSTGHLAGVLFESIAGIKLNHIAYRGTAPATNDLLGGHVDMMFDNVASSLQLYRSGSTKILAVCSASRIADLPNIPTTLESGLANFISASWIGLVAPPGTPQEIVAKINKDVVAALQTPAIQARLAQLGLEMIGNSPAQASAFLDRERHRWAQVLDKTGLKID